MSSRTLALLIPIALVGAAPAADVPQYNRDIRPILSENCFRCHGPDSGNRKAKLRLDDRKTAIGRGAIVPGKLTESELIARITSDDADVMMPPPDSHKKLTPAQKDLLKRWIESGAEYQPHWAYIAPVRPAVPANMHAVDYFIRAVLTDKKITPSPEADRRTLLRRLSLDLIGLPPTPAEVDAFVADTDPRAYEKQVERLLASPHFGERIAVPWLDLARYADTVGYHGDQNFNVFPYRDYVINSFNANKRFDQFTREQLAGDLLPNATPEQRVATAYNRLNMMTREGGAQPKEYLAKYAADRVRTVATTWLGSTMGCAECHDHKFDPFTAKDFYAMSAYFADVKQWGVYQDYNYTPNPDLRGWTNDHPFPPEIRVESAYLQQRRKRLRGEIDALGKKTESAGWWQKVVAHVEQHGDGWSTPKPALTNEKDETTELLDDNSVLITRKTKKGDAVKLRITDLPPALASLRVELLPHEQHKSSILRSGATTTVQLTVELQRGEGKPQRLNFYHADASAKEERYFNGYAMVGVLKAWQTAAAHVKAEQSATYLLDMPFETKPGDSLIVTIKSDAVGRVRVSTSPLGYLDPREPETDCKFPNSPRQRLASAPPTAEVFAEYKRLYREYVECQDGQAQCLTTEAWKPTTVRVLPRGNWQDETGAVVTPAPPAFLKKVTDEPRLTRLDLADWILAADNPLTARVFVNRLWKQLFGTGLSNVLDDVGAQGEWPTHPELLDWLAVEFRESGWDIKHMIRLLVTSATYRQDSKARPELRDLDPGNRFLAFMNPRRLEAEFIRDQALAAAGLLCRDLGGPPVKPYQPAGYYVNLQFPNRDYVADRDERQYRRGVYMHWQRTFLHPMLANFDAPSRDETCACRTNANTPQQALTMLNDPTFVEAARGLAKRVLAGKLTDEDRIDAAFRYALGRSAKAAERESLMQFLAAQRADSPDKPEVAWTEVCRVVLNLHEFVTRY